MIRTRSLFAAVLTTLLLGLVSPAASAATCSPASGTVKIVLGSGETSTISRGAGGAILVDGVACDAATVTNTDLIAVASTDGSTTFRIDLSGGPFAPGSVDEPGTSDEIEFTVDLQNASRGTLVVLGTSGNEVIGLAENPNIADETAINLADEAPGSTGEDFDVSMAGVSDVVVDVRGGSDVVEHAVIGGSSPSPSTLELIGGPGADRLSGGDDGDELVGGSGSDDLEGGDSQDDFYPQAGNDSVTDTGNNPADQVHFDSPDGTPIGTAGVTVDLGAGTSTGVSTGNDTLEQIEYVSGTPFADVLRGDAKHNEFFAGAGADRMTGLGENDSLTGGTGGDLYSGGGARDSVFLSGETGVTVDLALTGPQATGEGKDTFTKVENVFTGGGDDELFGNAGSNVLTSETGVDVVNGRGGDDVLVGFNGSFFDSGFTTFTGGGGIDTISYNGDAVDFSLNVIGTPQAGANDDVVTDLVENLSGTSDDDELTGNDLANEISGGSGDDTLNGLGGPDILDGGFDTDDCNGGLGQDTLLNCES
ncbi:MAG: calcium-binding protein [Actinomycetota bacterium]